MEIAALAISVVGLLVALWAAWSARRSATASHRSAEAAEEAVGYQRDEVERNRFVWAIDRHGKTRYVLRNDGTDTAYGVHLDLGDLVNNDQQVEFDEWPGGHEDFLFLTRAMGSQTDHITVTWHRQSDRSDQPTSTRALVE